MAGCSSSTRPSAASGPQKLIDTVGLSADKKRILKEYSKGMRQRIGLAQALINDPELVILDEPTSGLDPLGTRWMKDLIVSLRNQGKTIIMCSHRLEDVQDICDRVAILNEGELQKLGSVRSLLEDVQRLELRATGVQLNDALRRDLEEVLATARRQHRVRSAIRRRRWKSCSCGSSRRARRIPAGATCRARTPGPQPSPPVRKRATCRLMSRDEEW